MQSVTLPVHLISFSGNRDKVISALQWTTADEDKGDKFDVERSTDGLHFDRITTVAGNGGTGHTYKLSDTSAEPVLDYRIKITGIAGNSFYSRIIMLKDNNSRNNYIRLMNNPVTGNIPLQVAVEKTATLKLVLIDPSGKELLHQAMVIQTGINQLTITIPPGCSSGMYILRAETGQLNKTMRIMLAK